MSVHGVQGQCNYHRNEGCCDQSKQSCVIIMENSDLLWFSSHMHHLKTHVVQRVVVSVSLESKKKKCQLL